MLSGGLELALVNAVRNYWFQVYFVGSSVFISSWVEGNPFFWEGQDMVSPPVGHFYCHYELLGRITCLHGSHLLEDSVVRNQWYGRRRV